MRDPQLTDFGLGPQCQELSSFLQNEVPIASQVELIVVSPLRRTLQTMEQALGWLLEKGVPVIIKPEWQEISDEPSDTGSPIAIMEKAFPSYDWSTVDPIFPAKTGPYAYSKQDINRRGVVVREWLRNRPEKVIAVVSHVTFLRVAVSYRQYANADFRIFDFGEEEENDLRLIEWEMTEKCGGGLGKSPKGVCGWGEKESHVPETAAASSPVVDETLKL